MEEEGVVFGGLRSEIRQVAVVGSPGGSGGWQLFGRGHQSEERAAAVALTQGELREEMSKATEYSDA
jgi:hypothetical protein